MTNKEIKEIIKWHKRTIVHHNPDCECYPCKINKLATNLQTELAQLREENRWIPTTERLPKIGESVLLLASDKMGVPLPKIIYGRWAKYSKKELFTHWRPIILPKPN